MFTHPAFAAPNPLDAFPAAQPGMQRVVIELPEKSRQQEGEFKVELITGKMMITDGVNLVRLGAHIDAQNLKGWGHTYYEVQPASHSLSTMMAAPEGSPKVEKFVSAPPILINYNSRLPVVVYLPDGYQLRYRIWEAPPQFLPAPVQ